MINPAVDSPFARRKILLVEDDEVALAMYAAALRMEGFQVRTAADGLTALRIVESFDPDVVILDLRLPMASGFDVLHDLRATSLRMPVIAVSGHDPGIEAAQRDPDFFAALRKPFDPNDLVAVTRRALHHGTGMPA
jgi:two-component system OmpR family response regulator